MPAWRSASLYSRCISPMSSYRSDIGMITEIVSARMVFSCASFGTTEMVIFPLFHGFFQVCEGPETARPLDQLAEKTDQKEIEGKDEEEKSSRGEHEIRLPFQEIFVQYT